MHVAFTVTAVATLMALTAAATAHEPKAVKTVKVTQSLNDTALYEVKEDGTVLIDWMKSKRSRRASKILCSCPRLKSCWLPVMANGKPWIIRSELRT